MWAYRNFRQILTLKEACSKQGRQLTPEDLGLLSNASIVFDKEKILWCGLDKDFPDKYQKLPTTSFSDKILTPELVDSHTHLVFGGDRASEYVKRLNGVSYEELAKQGGGILHSTRETNRLDKEGLKTLARERIDKLVSFGVGTIEIKSGYGLNYKKEYEISKIIQELKLEYKKSNNRVQIFNTYMAAHAIPPEFSSSANYINEVVIPLMKDLASEKIIDAVDIFHEKNYFSTEDVVNLFNEAKKLGLGLKIHADEFNDNDGASLACEHQALSADHLLNTSEKGMKNLAKAKTVATLLPGTGFFLGKKQANGRRLLELGAQVALATDYNPGSCHFNNLFLLSTISAPQYGMNQTQLWAAITLNAAASLGFTKQGALINGFAPRFSFFNGASLDHLTYEWGNAFFDQKTTDQHYQRCY